MLISFLVTVVGEGDDDALTEVKESGEGDDLLRIGKSPIGPLAPILTLIEFSAFS